MNAAVLNSARRSPNTLVGVETTFPPPRPRRTPRTLNAGPETGGPLEEIEAIPGGAVVTLPSEPGPSTAEAMADFIVKYAKTGKAIQDSGSNIAGDFPFDKVLQGAATGAAVGTTIPGIGTAVGAVVGAVAAAAKWIIAQFGPGPSRWDNAGPNVHWWFTNYGNQAFLDWLDAQELKPFATVQDCARTLIYWHLQTNGQVLWYGNHATVAPLSGNTFNDDIYVYNAQFGVDYTESAAAWDEAFLAVEKMYADLSIDWRATVALYNAEGPGAGKLVYLKRVVLNDAGEVVAGEDGLTNAQPSTGAIVTAAAVIALLALPKTTR